MDEHNELYALRKPPTGSIHSITTCVPALGFRVGEPALCSTCSQPISNCEWLPPYHVELSVLGTTPGDLIWMAGVVLVSGRLRDLYESHGMSGLEGYAPVQVDRVDFTLDSETPVPEYFRASISRSTTMIDHGASGSEFSVPDAAICSECCWPIQGCVNRWSRTVIDSSSWGGEDIFIPRGSGEIVTTRRFRVMCELNKITNVMFIPTLEAGNDLYPIEIDR